MLVCDYLKNHQLKHQRSKKMDTWHSQETIPLLLKNLLYWCYLRERIRQVNFCLFSHLNACTAQISPVPQWHQLLKWSIFQLSYGVLCFQDTGQETRKIVSLGLNIIGHDHGRLGWPALRVRSWMIEVPMHSLLNFAFSVCITAEAAIAWLLGQTSILLRYCLYVLPVLRSTPHAFLSLSLSFPVLFTSTERSMRKIYLHWHCISDIEEGKPPLKHIKSCRSTSICCEDFPHENQVIKSLRCERLSRFFFSIPPENQATAGHIRGHQH